MLIDRLLREVRLQQVYGMHESLTRKFLDEDFFAVWVEMSSTHKQVCKPYET